MRITHWPIADRPREKLLSRGVAALTDAELVAIILKSGSRGKTALDVAKELLTEQGDLNKLRHAPLLQKVGIGRAKYATLQAALELGRRSIQQNLPLGTPLTNSQLTQTFLADRLREHPNEVFACLFLDTHLRLIAYEELFHGTINEASIYPREIVRRSLAHNAARLILAHNHPSGHPAPSLADRDVTHLIQQALALVDIQVVDHVIIGKQTHYSFAEKGLLINT